MAKRSAGLLIYRNATAGLEVLLVHPGGPFWSKKNTGAWSIPKGEYEDAKAAALREVAEEIGFLPTAEMVDLGEIRQTSGKLVRAWATAGELEPSMIKSNVFTTEWPPKSGRMQEFPEVDRAEWFTIDEARLRIVPAQAEFLDRLVDGEDRRQHAIPGNISREPQVRRSGGRG